MNDHASILALLAAGHLLAVLAPGPNNALVLQMSGYGRAATFLLAAGIFPAGLFWATLGMAGVGQAIKAMPGFELALQVIGGVYLLWLGAKIMRASFTALAPAGVAPAPPTRRRLFMLGFLTNLTNPKSIAWYTSIFAATGAFALPRHLQAAAVVGLPAIGLIWYVAFGFLLTSAYAREGFARVRPWIDRLTAMALIAFGLRLLASG